MHPADGEGDNLKGLKDFFTNNGSSECLNLAVCAGFARQRIHCWAVHELLSQPAVHSDVELRANRKSISHRCHLFEVAFV